MRAAAVTISSSTRSWSSVLETLPIGSATTSTPPFSSSEARTRNDGPPAVVEATVK